MKKEVTKKSKLWLWLLIGAVALVAVAGVVLAMVLGGGEEKQDGPQGGRADLYWNVDRKTYTENSESGLSTREPGADGEYKVRFAYNGDLLELTVADKQLINYIDTMDCMGVVQDADGVVIDVVDPKTLATETAKMFYVRKVENGIITINSSMAMNGMSMDVPIADVTEVYDVTSRPEQIGQKIEPDVLESMDAVTVYSNGLGEATHVFVVNHPVESPVYWRADTGNYNSTDKHTTRVPDENGYYTIPFYVDGEYVELKCDKVGIVNTIDAKNRFKAHTGLVLDENGCIVDNMLAATGIRGLLGCEMYDVTAVDGKSFSAEAMLANSGEIYENTLADDAKIYDVSLAAKPEVRGKAVDSMKIGDRIVVFENAEGEAMLVFVAHRLVDSPMYFNMTKKYSSAKKETTRTPDSNGWYTIEMFSDGVVKTFKTQDKALINKIDSQNNRGVGLELDGDVITYVWEGECVAGYGALVGYSVQNVTGSIISMTPPNNPDSISNRILHPTAKVYNMSGVKQKKGEITELLPEDYCIFWRNPKSELVYVYVIRRKVDAPIFFSLTRKWDSTKQQSTREPVDGWFVYECASEGKHVTVKTKSRECANFLDSQSPQTFALKVDGNGVIQEYYETTAVTGGSKAYLNTDVKKISGNELTLYNATTDKTTTAKMAEGCKVYNVSSVYETIRGEKGSVQVTDRIQTYTNIKGEIVLIYIRIRSIDADVYFSKERVKAVTAEGKTARQPDADGWYVFQCALKGEEVTVKTKDINKATLMDAQSPQAFALKVDKNGVIEKAYPATAAVGGSTRALNAVVKSVDGGKIVVRLTTGEDFEMPMASSYEVYNVSDVYTDHWGEKSTIQVGDTLQSYTNKENKISLVYIRTRPADVKLYWNVNRQYDSENKKSTRELQADGYFHVELAVNGAIQEFLVQDQSVINYIDSANGAVACTIKGGIITKAQSAIYGKGIWSSTEAAIIATVQEVKENSLVIKDSTGATREIPMAAEYVCYDVSGKSEFVGQAATAKVGDYGRIYANMNMEAMYFYIMSRGSSVTPESQDPVVLYWNLHRNTDPTPDADGYYHFEMAVGGEIKMLKTKSEDAANYADGANGAVALTLSANDPTEFTKAQSGIYATGVKTTGATGKVSAVESAYVIVGTDKIQLLAENVGIYDVSGTGAFIGEATELKIGDNITRCYVDEGGYALYIYISARETVIEPEPEVNYDNSDLQLDADNKAQCTYCGEVVEWTALEQITETTMLTEGVHYYLSADLNNTAHYIIKKNCVHLNGHNITSTGRAFHVDNSTTNLLTIMGNGTVTGASTAAGTANTAGATISVRGNLNLIGGTYKHENSTLPTIIMAKPQQTMNIYKDVKIEGAEGVTGTNLYVMMGVVNMYGGEIIGGTATPNGTTGGLGDNVYVHGWTGSGTARAEFNMFGGYVDGGIYATKTTETYQVSVAGDAVITDKNGGLTLDSASGAILTVGSLGADAQVYVTANGAVTDVFTNAEAYANTKILPAANVTLTVENNVIMAQYDEPAPVPVPVWKLAWVVEPQFDATNSVTTRTADAEGYYYVELSIDGVTETYKTKETGLLENGHGGIDYVDQSGSKDRAISIQLLSEDSLEFTNALGATSYTGAKGAKVTTITAIEGDVIRGEGYEAKLAADAKIFDVSTQATVEGEFSTLKVGDYARFYTTEAGTAGDILYAYIYTRAAEEDPEVPVDVDMNEACAKADEMAAAFANGGDVEAECPACGKTVTWKALPALTTGTLLVPDGHYYVAEDLEVGGMYYNVKDGVQVCINLNGKTIKTNERVFYVDTGAQLTIMGSGNVIGGRSVHPNGVERCGSALEIVGEDTIVNLCGGTWTKSKNDLDVVGIRARTGSDVNIYDGTVINIGQVQGNALWIAGGNVNLRGGEVNGDVYVRTYTAAGVRAETALNLTVSDITINGKLIVDNSKGAPLAVTLSGAPVIAELVTDATLPLNIGRMTAGADVKVTAEGAFTNANPNLQDYVDAGFLTAKEEGKLITVTEGVASVVDATATGYDNSNLVFEEGTTRAYCTYCGEVKEWTALQSTVDGSTDTLGTEGGHFYLAEDLLENKGRYSITATTCVHLNGHNVTNVANRAFSVNKNMVLTIMGNGVVTGSYNGTTTANVAAATINSLGNLNLIGGTYCGAETSALPTILEARGAAEKYVKVYDGVTITGGADKAGLSVAYGHAIVYGGTIDRMDVLGYDIAGTNAQCSATLLGGTVEKLIMAARDPQSAYKDYQLELIIGGTAKAAVELAEGAKITISEEGMKAGAQITVTAADGAISNVAAKAADYLALGYFKAADENKTITEKDGILSIG